MSDQREIVISYVKANGPVLPVQIAKHIDTNILFASAILAELVERKSLKITHFSVGGSPLYYLSGQEDLMDRRLSQTLSGREKDAYNLIKEKRVVKESELEPWQRVAIKSLKDFTVSMNVDLESNNTVFWRYHLFNLEEANKLIEELFKPQKLNVVETNIQEILHKDLPVNNLDLNIDVKELTEKIKEELLKEIKPIKTEKPKQIKPKETLQEKKLTLDGRFYNEIIKFFNENNIKIINEELVKKDKEFDFTIEMPSSFGDLKYFVKAKSKTSISDADVSIAFSQCQGKNLPMIYLINGKISKKAISLVENKLKGQLIIKEL